jgi:hypothetical protein
MDHINNKRRYPLGLQIVSAYLFFHPADARLPLEPPPPQGLGKS